MFFSEAAEINCGQNRSLPEQKKSKSNVIRFLPDRRKCSSVVSWFFLNGQDLFWPKQIPAGTEKVKERRYRFFSGTKKSPSVANCFFPKRQGPVLAKKGFGRNGENVLASLADKPQTTLAVALPAVRLEPAVRFGFLWPGFWPGSFSHGRILLRLRLLLW